MPFVQCMFNTALDDETCDTLKHRIADVLESVANKSESSLMIAIHPSVHLYYQGKKKPPAAYIYIRYIGEFDTHVKEEIARECAHVIELNTAISRDQIYVTFTSVKKEDWAWKGHMI